MLIAGYISSFLLVFAAGCSLNKQSGRQTDAGQVEAISAEPAIAENAGEKQAAKAVFTANQFCAACHYGFMDEALASTHEKAGIGCERCHGESERHRSDEDNITPPEIMYPKNKINPTCMMCHPRHEIRNVTSHEPLLSGAKTIFDSDSNNDGGQLYCTTCHAKEHHINVRTIRWNKATGELLNE